MMNYGALAGSQFTNVGICPPAPAELTNWDDSPGANVDRKGARRRFCGTMTNPGRRDRTRHRQTTIQHLSARHLGR